VTARFSRALPFGANLIDDGRTRFRLYAPAQRAVAVAIEDRPHLPMTDRGDGWFEATADCGAGTHYRYQLGSGEAIPDPVSRAQAGDVHDCSIVVDPLDYQWRHPQWRGRPWRETVLYELHCGLMGGFRGVAAALPRLAALGITAVELMPVNDFSGRRNWGYDGVLPFAPDAAYGTPEGLKALIDAAHDHGMMMFLDVVYNHFGADGNYLGLFAPVMFRQDFHTPWGAGIDFHRPEVRRFFIENALYWLLEYRFDGLRFDAVHAISDPDWLDVMAQEVRATVEPGRHVHLVLENDANVASHLRGDFNAQWNDDAHHVLHVLLTGEREGYYADYADGPAAKLARSLAEGFVYQGEPSPHRGGEPRGTASADLPPLAFVLFLQNHDQIGNRAFGERLTVLSAPAALEAAIALQMLAPQIPLLFMGEEDASRSPFLFFADYKGELADAVREGRRREFAKFAAFADPEQRSHIPDPLAASTFAASVPQGDPALGASRFALYQNLLALRRTEIVPRLAGARALGAVAIGPAAVMARWRMGDGAILGLAVNLDAAPVPVDLPQGRVLFEGIGGAAASAVTGTLPGRVTVAFLEPAS
jgi:maltooligosyltrehalose trehalohydrolase